MNNNLSFKDKIIAVWEKEIRVFKYQARENKELKKHQVKWRNHDIYKGFSEKPVWEKAILWVLYPPFMANNWLWYFYLSIPALALILIFWL